MTTPPLPDTACCRCTLDYLHDTGLKGGSRFYIGYSGAAPSGANCVSLATLIETSWVAQLQGAINEDWTLVEVDVLDIASDSGLSGNWTGSEAGSRSGDPLPAQVAMNVEYGIARRYRGGKPRMYLPPSITDDLNNDVTWADTWVATVQAAVAEFFTLIEAGDIGAMGTLTHINLSYYKGFNNVENTSGRMRAAPKYRTPTALSDPVTGYFAKVELGSQRRRRVSTTY